MGCQQCPMCATCTASSVDLAPLLTTRSAWRMEPLPSGSNCVVQSHVSFVCSVLMVRTAFFQIATRESAAVTSQSRPGKFLVNSSVKMMNNILDSNYTCVTKCEIIVKR
ncbi:uncharacterized protein LOC128222561 [Mya arenaria]|uniref:uncharacterized protein LOC128222561 n=1 Tax=Mya arenaria TaxID=6604 RepID=UPI0022E6543F|nr:uncharacterized protein LOC128222561 [Mya arenaria]